MEYGICHLAIISGRSDASDRSEMVTQFLFGEQFEILERTPKWTHVRSIHDQYTCWLDNKQFIPLTEPIAGKRSLEMLSGVGELRVPFGAFLPDYSNETFSWNNERVVFEGTVGPIKPEDLFAHNNKWLNTPYLWGGRSTFGVDCSGLVQVMFAVVGIDLPRDASQQAEIGETIETIDLAQPGDLAFFDNEAGNITHVGVIMQDRTILHASGKVRVDTIDQEGILNEESSSYSHKLCLVKRIL